MDTFPEFWLPFSCADRKRGHMLSKLLKWNAVVNRTLAILAGLLVAGIGVSTIIDVGGRFLFNHPLAGSVEIATEMLVMIVFLAITYVQVHKRHIRLEFLMERISPQAQNRLNFLTEFFVLGTASFLAWRCILKAEYSWRIGETAAGIVPIPYAPARTIVAIGFTLFAITVFLQICDRFRKKS